jgi:hypothetical protein
MFKFPLRTNNLTNRFLRVGIIICFMSTSIDAYAVDARTLFKSRSHAQRFLENEKPKKEQALEDLSVKFPAHLGNVTQSHNSGKHGLIIHIQDRHADETAQFNIAGIIDFLEKNYNIKLLCLEGASERLDTSYYDNFPNNLAKKLTSQFFVKQGLFTGPEYFKILNKDRPVEAYGVEDKELYFKHVLAYKKHGVNEKELLLYLNTLYKNLDALKMQILSVPLKIIYEREKAYKEKQIKLNEFVLYLINEAEKKDISLSVYPNLKLFSEIAIAEKNIDFQKAELERDTLIKALSDVLKNDELAVLIDKSAGFKAGRTSALAFYEHLRNTVSFNSSVINSADYKELFAYMDYVKLSVRADSIILFDEIDMCVKSLKAAYFTNNTQRLFEDCIRYVILSIDLYGLRLTEKNLNELKTLRNQITLQQIISFINSENEKYSATARIAIPPADNGAFENALDYYELALKRDTALIDNTLRRMAVSGENSAILVTGGFHTQGIVEVLKKLDMSYIVACPKIGNDDCDRVYKVQMRDQMPSPEAIKNFINNMLSDALNTGNLADWKHAQSVKNFYPECMKHIEDALANKTESPEKTSASGNEGFGQVKRAIEDARFITIDKGHIIPAQENGLLHRLHIDLAMKIKDIINGRDRGIVAVYGGAGADCSSLLSTNAAKAYFIDKTPISMKHFIEIQDKWIGLENPLVTDTVAIQYLSVKHKMGYAASSDDFMKNMEIKILTELTALGVTLEDIEITQSKPDITKISFMWNYPNRGKKKYEIIYIQADITKPAEYLDKIPEAFDIYYQKAGRTISENYDKFLGKIFSKLKKGGYFVTDDHSLSSETPNALPKHISDVLSDPINTNEMQIIREKINKTISESGRGYGWDLQIRRKETKPNANLNKPATFWQKKSWPLKRKAIIFLIGALTLGNIALTPVHHAWAALGGSRIAAEQVVPYKTGDNLKLHSFTNTILSEISLNQREKDLLISIAMDITGEKSNLQTADIAFIQGILSKNDLSKDTYWELAFALKAIAIADPESADKVISVFKATLNKNGVNKAGYEAAACALSDIALSGSKLQKKALGALEETLCANDLDQEAYQQAAYSIVGIAKELPSNIQASTLLSIKDYLIKNTFNRGIYLEMIEVLKIVSLYDGGLHSNIINVIELIFMKNGLHNDIYYQAELLLNYINISDPALRTRTISILETAINKNGLEAFTIEQIVSDLDYIIMRYPDSAGLSTVRVLAEVLKKDNLSDIAYKKAVNCLLTCASSDYRLLDEVFEGLNDYIHSNTLNKSAYTPAVEAIQIILTATKSRLADLHVISSLEIILQKIGLDSRAYVSAVNTLQMIQSERNIIKPGTIAYYALKLPNEIESHKFTSPEIYFNEYFQNKTKFSSEIERYVISEAVYRFIKQNDRDPGNSEDIVKAVDFILELRDHKVLNRNLYSPDTTVINILHAEDRFSKNKLELTAIGSGADMSKIASFKGAKGKQKAIDMIEKSKGYLTLVFSGHGGKTTIELDQVKEAVEIDEKTISVEELGDAMLKRGDIDKIIFLNLSCFSYDFNMNLLHYLHYMQRDFKRISLPTVWSEADFNQPGYGNFAENRLLEEAENGTLTIKSLFDILALSEEVFKLEKSALIIQIPEGMQNPFGSKGESSCIMILNHPNDASGTKNILGEHDTNGKEEFFLFAPPAAVQISQTKTPPVSQFDAQVLEKASSSGDKPEGIAERETGLLNSIEDYRTIYMDVYEKLNPDLEINFLSTISDEGRELAQAYHDLWQKLTNIFEQGSVLIYPVSGLDIIPLEAIKEAGDIKARVINHDPDDADRGYDIFSRVLNIKEKQEDFDPENQAVLGLRWGEDALDKDNYLKIDVEYPGQKKILLLKGFYRTLKSQNNIEHVDALLDTILTQVLKPGDNILILEKEDLEQFNEYLDRRANADNMKAYSQGIDVKVAANKAFLPNEAKPIHFWDESRKFDRVFIFPDAFGVFEKTSSGGFKKRGVVSLEAVSKKIMNPRGTEEFTYVSKIKYELANMSAGKPSAYIIERGCIFGDTLQVTPGEILVIPREILEIFIKLKEEGRIKSFLILDISITELNALLDAYGLGPCEFILSSEEVLNKLGIEYDPAENFRKGRINTLTSDMCRLSVLKLGSGGPNIGIIANPITDEKSEKEFSEIYDDLDFNKENVRVAKIELMNNKQAVFLPRALFGLIELINGSRNISDNGYVLLVDLPEIVKLSDEAEKAVSEYIFLMKQILKSA